MESIWTQRGKTEEGNGWQGNRGANGQESLVGQRMAGRESMSSKLADQEVVTRTQEPLQGHFQVMARPRTRPWERAAEVGKPGKGLMVWG